MWRFLLDLLFPPTSLEGKSGTWVTPREEMSFRTLPRRLEDVRLVEHGLPSMDRLVAAASYAHVPLLQTALRRLKYHRVRGVEEPLGKLLAEVAFLLDAPPDAVLCPVPLHRSREHERGFNQSQLLAEFVAMEYGWDIQELLTRKRSTGHQAHRSRSERVHALDHAFVCNDIVLPQHVILVDDICTSGSTLEECAKTLKEAGVQTVDGLVLALG
jgi:ComF family protein